MIRGLATTAIDIRAKQLLRNFGGGGGGGGGGGAPPPPPPPPPPPKCTLWSLQRYNEGPRWDIWICNTYTTYNAGKRIEIIVIFHISPPPLLLATFLWLHLVPIVESFYYNLCFLVHCHTSAFIALESFGLKVILDPMAVIPPLRGAILFKHVKFVCINIRHHHHSSFVKVKPTCSIKLGTTLIVFNQYDAVVATDLSE